MSESYQSPTRAVQWPIIHGPPFLQASSIQDLQELCRLGLSMPRSDLKPPKQALGGSRDSHNGHSVRADQLVLFL